MMVSDKCVSVVNDPLVSVADVKHHLNVALTSDDAYLLGLIQAAQAKAEGHTFRALRTQSRVLCWNDPWQREIIIPMPPLGEVTAVKAITSAGDEVIADTYYTVVTATDLGRVVLKPTAYAWPVKPTTLLYAVEYTCGMGPTAIEPDIIQALYLTVGAWYANREDIITGTIVSELPSGAKDLLEQFVVNWETVR